jgi:exosortase K
VSARNKLPLRGLFAVMGPALLALSLAALIKHYFSQAGADDLDWVLGPSCALVSWVGGIALSHGPGAGYITHEYRMVVGPACAGVNFFIIAILALYFSFQGRFAGLVRKALWLIEAVALAYAATIASNGLRILGAAHLYTLDVHGSYWNPERLHRMLGTLIYCASLFALCAVVGRFAGDKAAGRESALVARLVPLGSYVGVAVGVPLLNRAYVHNPGRSWNMRWWWC